MTREEAIKIIAAAPGSPAAKRKMLKRHGLLVDYQPHQGKREMERRKRRMNQNG